MSVDLEMSPGLGGDVRVIGVGGAGGNAVNRMIEAGVTGVRFIAVNTDTQALGRCEAPVRLHLGKPGSARDGAGGNPEVGMRAAESVIEDIDALVAGADMVFITAGMGGGLSLI
ncbi:MAG: cell division protein FtsZ, partial [Proteobacteria bacterium]|nr:cell division protein FtsZ [Pseudomonadota bacterium]